MSRLSPLPSSVPDKPGDLPSKHGLDVRVVHITPKLAQEWLTHNFGNRTLKLFNIDKFGRDMLNGRWDLTGETLIWDSDGHLRNGQNRLTACVQSGAPFTSLVVWGVHPDAFKNMDRGTSRTVADVLGIEGVENYKTAAAVAAYIWRDEHGKSPAQGGKTAVTPAEAIDVLERHPGVKDSMCWASDCKQAGLSPSVAVWLHYKLSRVDPGIADVFFSALYSRANLPPGHPVLVLHRQLTTGTYPPGFSRVAVQMNHVVRAWNAFVSGRDLKQIKMHRSGDPSAVPAPPTSQRWLLAAS